jgi:hypothetical protein
MDKSTRRTQQSDAFREPRRARRNADPILVLGFASGQRLPRQMLDGESIAQAWERACEEIVFVCGERVRVGLAYGIVMVYEHDLDENVFVEWLGYRVH